MYEGQKVRVLTMAKKPIGTIVRGEYEQGSMSPIIYWVRLKNGFLLKDVRDIEIEWVWKSFLKELGRDVAWNVGQWSRRDIVVDNMKLILIVTLLVILSAQPVLAKGSFSRPSFRSAPRVYVAPKTQTKVNTSAKTIPVKSQSIRPIGVSYWNPFAPNFWFWMFLFGTVSHNSQVTASSSAAKK